MTKYNYRVNGKFAKRPEATVVVSQPKKINHLVLVVDKSGSMSGREKDVKRFVNKWIDDNKELANKFGQETYISIINYSYQPEVIVKTTNINNVGRYDKYSVGGMTATFEAQANAITILDSIPILQGEDVSFVVNHITDGEENQSWGGPYYSDYTKNLKWVIDSMIERQSRGNWTFTFLLPPGCYKQKFINDYKIEAGNIRVWDNTEEGIKEAEAATTSGLFAYYGARSIGGQSVKNFYETVQVDLSAIGNLSNVAKQQGLKNLAGDYSKVSVPRECSTKELVEDIEKCGKYRAGMVFYELTKKEKIQPSKEVLVMEKGKPAIYGGAEARHLIGLPDGKYARVDPFNMSKYKIFVRSNAGGGNRVLVRGTEALIKK